MAYAAIANAAATAATNAAQGVLDAIAARKSALAAAASATAAEGSKNTATDEAAAIPASASGVAELIVPDLPADLNTALTGFAATIAAKQTEANNARASLLLSHIY